MTRGKKGLVLVGLGPRNDVRGIQAAARAWSWGDGWLAFDQVLAYAAHGSELVVAFVEEFPD